MTKNYNFNISHNIKNKARTLIHPYTILIGVTIRRSMCHMLNMSSNSYGRNINIYIHKYKNKYIL